MAAEPPEYQRLPGRGFRRQGMVSVTARRSRLWLGRDHLLLVESQYFTEEYRRFPFRDIQTIVLRKTDTGKYFTLVWMSLALPTLFGVVASGGGWRIFWIILTGLFASCLLINALYGPTCVCQMRTAVQTEDLPSLRRLRRARKIIDRLRPFIAGAQGQLAPEEVAARLAQPPDQAMASVSELPPVVTPAPQPPDAT